jgi:hypothetical protein
MQAVDSGGLEKGLRTMDGRLKKWLGWLEVIEKDIQQLLIQQHIFWEVQDIIRNNKDIQIPSAFYGYLGRTYIAYIAMGIRRQVKDHKDSISFARLLKEISETPRVLSRQFYKSLYHNFPDVADGHFDRFAGKDPNHAAIPGRICSNLLKTLNNTLKSARKSILQLIGFKSVKCRRGIAANHVSLEMVSDDLQTLKSVAEKIEGFADKRIAHHDRKPPSDLPTFGEADECLKKMDELAVKYIRLFRGQALSSLMPTIEYDWTEIFRVPWLPPDNGAGDR